jgi:hypothetical protein
MKFLIFNLVGRAVKRAAMLSTVVTALLVLSAKSLALDLGETTSRTPYDPYLGPMFSVFGHLGGGQPDPVMVEQLVREGRAFRYSFNSNQPHVPQSPEETESSRTGDCKAKSLWLASRMDSRKVRFVIGKAKRSSSMNHAWLIWQAPDGWLILDATFYSRPLDPARVSSNEFLPIYSYSPGAKYAHAMAAPTPGAKHGDHL